MKYTTIKSANYNANETMKALSKESCSLWSEEEKKDFSNILEGFGASISDNDVFVLDKYQLIWLASHIITLGKTYGRKENNVK